MNWSEIQTIPVDMTICRPAKHIRAEEWVRRYEAESRIVHLEAKLERVQGLLPQWEEGDFNLDDYTRGVMNGSHKCADELRAALTEETP